MLAGIVTVVIASLMVRTTSFTCDYGGGGGDGDGARW